MKPPFVLFEVANVHGGNRDVLLRMVEQYKEFDYQPKGIKFQTFKPDRIALPDFSWYKTYQELFLEPAVWSEIIADAAEGGEVWLDLFDTYGVEILQANRAQISGLKLQASVLDNLELITALREAGIGGLRLMINVSGYDLGRIHEYVAQFGSLKPQQLILQMGFQAYPTAVCDSGLQKVAILRAAFPDLPLCFADHASGGSPFARQLPALAVVAGCTYLEKHFCLGRIGLKYDFHSALEPTEVKEMLAAIKDLVAASEGPFVNAAEAEYLKKSYQSPIAQRALPAGSLVSQTDLCFRRTDQPGLTWPEVVNKQSSFSVLAATIAGKTTIGRQAFRRARIGVIVACRMKSSRLKNKAIVPIHGAASVERCLHNCLQIHNADEVILATSTLEEDSVLAQHTLGGRVKFWRGDPDDVIQRYLGACDRFGIDVVVRVTADCPVVSPEITALLLQRHFQAGADYTAPREFAVGSSGEIINVEALRRVIAMLGKAEHSEYMTWYFRNNPDVFKVNLVDLPKELTRDYRLTLDYPEDLEMFNRLYARLEERGFDPSLPNVFSLLDADPSLPALNGHLTLRYQTDSQLIEQLNRETRICVPEPIP